MRTTFILITLLFSISASSQDLATVTIDFSKVLGPEVTACPVLDAASVSALNSCEDEHYSSVFKKCLVAACGKPTCSWYKTVAKSCLNSFCPDQSVAWSGWMSSECSITGSHTPYSRVLTNDGTTSEGNIPVTTSVTEATATTTTAATESILAISTSTTITAATESILATSTSTTQGSSSSTAGAEAGVHVGGLGAVLAGGFGILAALM
ncbi:hypothetical protein BKA61DRAFT_652277 [Leptodontidium sp. MPI-SDFR-AT-0119]|nr:hypothetical protein BKA61DRAFT_652277 [Leptodontidium sp. MPI-SDFR-AT-0119]